MNKDALNSIIAEFLRLTPVDQLEYVQGLLELEESGEIPFPLSLTFLELLPTNLPTQ